MAAAGAGRGPRSKPKRRLPPEVLTDEEVRALLDACGRYTHVALRNRALITLMYRAGLRVSEALALQPKDVDLANGIVRVLHGKGDRYRAVGLDPGAAAVVAAWLAERGRGQRVGGRVAARVNPPLARVADPLAAAPLLCTVYGTPLTTGYVRRLMKRLGRQAGIAKRVHAHGLRHTHAAQLRSEGVDVGIISRQLGHRSLLTTIRYLDHVQPTAVVEAMRGRVWETLPHVSDDEHQEEDCRDSGSVPDPFMRDCRPCAQARQREKQDAHHEWKPSR
ncbi:MAG: site-specific integrase [Phycisphaeraceae bacterium]|nr:site-specific integrase [Phycisphaeraceae bacterium]